MDPLWPRFAPCVLFSFFASPLLAQNSNLTEHQRYIHNQSEQNTRYFNNADSYPKPTPNVIRYFPPEPSHSHELAQPQPVIQVHIPTREEIAADFARKSAAGDVAAKISLANCYYYGWGVPLKKEESYRLYREAGRSNPHAEFIAGNMLFVGDGVPVNLQEGKALIQHAATAGDPEAIGWTPLIDQAVADAEKGDVPAMAQAGTQFLNGIGVERDVLKGLRFLEQAANRGDLQSMQNLAYWYRTRTPGVPYDMSKAHAWALKAAEAGDLDAMNTVGADLVANDGVAVDGPGALRWFLLAASKGSAAAAENVGVLYNGGYPGIPADRAKAAAFYQQAAARGLKTAGLRHALLYEGTDGGPPEPAKAVALLTQLSAKGDADAESYLGDHYESGGVVDKDLDKAVAWLTKSAQHGSARGAYELATHYIDGVGVPVQEAKGAQLIRQAAAQGFAPAISSFGLGTFFGTFGFDQDEYEGARLVRIAADKGDSDAPFTLGELYDAGVTVAKDHAAAVRWFWIGAGRGDTRAIEKLTELGLYAVAEKALVPGELRPGGTGPGLQLDTVSNQPASPPKKGRIPPVLLPEPWTTILDPKKLSAEDATAARERILNLHSRPHTFADYAYVMLAGLYTKAKSADPKLTQQGWIFGMHDRALTGDVEAGYLWGAARICRFAVGLGPDQERERYIGAMMKKGKLEAERDYAIVCMSAAEPDEARAFALARKAADAGLPSALSLLGEYYWHGIGTEEDTDAAGKAWKKAADAGDVIAQYLYGTNTASGHGLPQDEAAGVAYLRKAADAGDDRAMLDYGIALDLGLYGQTKDVDGATKYIDRAALAGNITALDFMGRKYSAGKGVAQDDAWACVYWRAAAQNGNVDSQFSLGRCLLNGVGVAKDQLEAMKWLSDASTHDNDDATQLLDEFAEKDPTAFHELEEKLRAAREASGG